MYIYILSLNLFLLKMLIKQYEEGFNISSDFFATKLSFFSECCFSRHDEQLSLLTADHTLILLCLFLYLWVWKYRKHHSYCFFFTLTEILLICIVYSFHIYKRLMLSHVFHRKSVISK